MNTRDLMSVLCFTAIVFITPQVEAGNSSLFDMADQFDQVDQQDFRSALDKANSCTQVHNFTCSEEQLRKAAKLVNGSSDKQAFNSATQNLQAERQRVKDEAIAKAESKRQIRLAEERAEEDRRAERKRREREEAEEYAAYSRSNTTSQLQQSQRDLDALFARTNKQLQDNTNRAFQQQREQQQARQRAADAARAAENERIRRQNQRVALQEQTYQQEPSRHQEQVRQQEQTRQANNLSQQQREQQQAQQRAQEVARAEENERIRRHGELQKKTRCVMEVTSSSRNGNYTEEEARAAALRYGSVKAGGPNNIAIISSTITSCKHEDVIGFICLALTRFEMDTEGSRGTDGKCASGSSAGISK